MTETPSPTPQPPPGLIPSNSTNASLVSGALVTVIIYALSLKGIFLPPGIEAAVAMLVSTAAGYLPRSGRQ